MGKKNVDYSLYLVTDSTPAILGDKDIGGVVEAACKGGVTIVQYRDKTSDTGGQVSVAKRLHAITRKYGVPLLINDRVDVALAVGCEGVHIGQDDLDLATARKLLGNDAIIGVTVSNLEETRRAVEGGADYLGIGTVYATPTKENTKSIIGTTGVQELLDLLAELDPNKSVGTVCIGGINAANTSRVLFQTTSRTGRKLDGVAVVSAIMAATDPESASKELLQLVKSLPPSVKAQAEAGFNNVETKDDILAVVPKIITTVDSKTPLSHNMTNLVVQNFAANVALSIGASPIMANYGEEAADLAKLGGALVVNMGTVTPDGLLNYGKALKAYNAVGQPVVFDPVGAGATAVRRSAVRTIMAGGYIDVLKGNQGEIMTVAGSQIQQRGVDSSHSALSTSGIIKSVRDLASKLRNVVIMTGKADCVSDGRRTVWVKNGHEYLGMITGTGCVLGTTVSAMIAVYPQDKFLAVVAGLLHLEIAAEIAAERSDVKGPGTFVPAFLDELYNVRKATVAGDLAWLERAKIEIVASD